MRCEDTRDDPGIPWGEASVTDRLALSRTLLSIMPDGVFFADGMLRIRYANPSFVKAMELDSHDAAAPSLDRLYPDADNGRALANARAALASVGWWSGELTRMTPEGDVTFERLTMAVAPEAGSSGVRYVGICHDLTAERTAETRLEWARNHDELTGLPNRALFVDAVDAVIRRCDETGPCLVVATADLDGFKRFNNDYGHETGDAILKAAARRLVAVVRAGDMTARTAGDEFSVLFHVRSPEEAVDAAARVRAAFEEPLVVDGAIHAVRASVGAAVWPRDGRDASSLLAAADLAMQACKDRGRDGVLVFDDHISMERRCRCDLEADLRNAIDGGLLSVHYQPVVSMASGCVESVEALVRWRDPVRGDVEPDRFIPLAEETGLILGLGELVLRAACDQGGRWSRCHAPDLKVAVNVSTVQLERADFPALLSDVLTRTGLPPERLVVEITESVLLSDVARAAGALARLKALGVSISVDDFGTGYSSFSYLKNLPLDIVKIDREYVKDIGTSLMAREIAGGMIDLAHRMNLSVVAEGVETAEQFYILRALDCDHAQGFLFSRALPACELEGRYLARGGGSRFSTFLLRQ